MGHPPDENLPEVVPDQSPQALTEQQADLRHDQLEERDPKYPAIFDDAPKYAAPDAAHLENEQTRDSMHHPSSPSHAVSGKEVEAGVQGRQTVHVCGLTKRLFWTLIAIVVIVLAAAIGGGVGGAMAKSRSGGNVGADSNVSSSSSPK